MLLINRKKRRKRRKRQLQVCRKRFCLKRHQGTECPTESQPCGQAPLLLLGGQFFSREIKSGRRNVQVRPLNMWISEAFGGTRGNESGFPASRTGASIHFSMDRAGDLSRKFSLARQWERGPTMFQDRPLLPARREIKLAVVQFPLKKT